MLMTLYATGCAGLNYAPQVSDIDSQRMVIHVRRERVVVTRRPLTPKLLGDPARVLALDET